MTTYYSTQTDRSFMRRLMTIHGTLAADASAARQLRLESVSDLGGRTGAGGAGGFGTRNGALPPTGGFPWREVHTAVGCNRRRSLRDEPDDRLAVYHRDW
jgi:hypothetical protein